MYIYQKVRGGHRFDLLERGFQSATERISSHTSVSTVHAPCGCECLNKLRNFGRRIVKTLCTYFHFNNIKCIVYFQYSSVKIVSFSFYFPFSFIQLGSCSSEPLVSFSPFIVRFLLFYKTYL